MSKIYHAAPIILGEGSIILPGNWGRIVKAIGEPHPQWLSEKTFEDVRRARFPTLPSRLDACFACPSEEVLRFFVANSLKGNPRPPILYEVEEARPGAARHLADYNLIRANLAGETLEGNAERYWRGDFRYTIKDGPPSLRCEEIVTASPLRIVRRLP